MKEKARHTLITAEIMGFFLIIIAILGILTNMRVFIIAAVVIFSLIILVAALFVVFAMRAVKEERKRQPKHRNK